MTVGWHLAVDKVNHAFWDQPVGLYVYSFIKLKHKML